MPRKKAEEAPAKGIDWGAVLDSLQSGGGEWMFLKAGTSRIRLLHSPQDQLPYTQVTTQYRGKSRTKFMILAYSPEDEEPEIRGLVIPKTAWKSILAMLADGFDFFHPEEGYGVTIMKTGSGFNTEYSVLPSKRAIPVPAHILKELKEQSVAELGPKFDKQQLERENNPPAGDEDGDAVAEAANLGAEW